MTIEVTFRDQSGVYRRQFGVDQKIRNASEEALYAKVVGANGLSVVKCCELTGRRYEPMKFMVFLNDDAHCIIKNWNLDL
jgi:hypothetical protein